MARDKVAGILDAHTALDARLDKVADNTQDGHNHAAKQRIGQTQLIEMHHPQNEPDENRAQDATNKALPALVGRDLGNHLVFADTAAHDVGKRIGDPKGRANTH